MAEKISTPLKSSQRDEHPISEAGIDEFQSYLNSLTLVERRGFLKVSYSDLLLFSKNFPMAEELLEEAITFAAVHKKWSFWTCCCCYMKFTDSESHFQHVMGNHMNLDYSSLDFTSLVFPRKIHEGWISTINHANWEPADTSLVFTTLEKKLGLLSAKIRRREEVSELELKICDPKQWVRGYFFGRSWPLSDDFTRKSCLKSIQFRLQSLLLDGHLEKIHLDYIINYAMIKLEERELQGGVLGALGLQRTHLCICLLGASELEGILNFLIALEERRVVHDGVDQSTTSFETDVSIVLNNKSIYLDLDEHSHCESSAIPAMNTDHHKPKELHSSDSLLSWIFSEPKNLQQPESWANLRQQRLLLGTREILHFQRILKKRVEEFAAFEQHIRKTSNLFTKSYSIYLQMKERGNWIVKLTKEIHQFESSINANAAAFDYRQFLLFLVKAYFKDRLKKVINNGTRYVSEDVAAGKDDGEDSSDSDSFVYVVSQTTDSEIQSLVPEQNDSDRCLSEDLEIWNVVDEEETKTLSDNMRSNPEAVEMEKVNHKDLPGFVEGRGECAKMREQEEDFVIEMLGISDEEADIQAAIEQSLAEQGEELSDMHGPEEGAVSEMLGENTQRKKAWIEDDVGHEDLSKMLSKIQHEFSDAVQEWHKTIMAVLNEVDREGALAQCVLQKEKVFALFDKFVQIATKLL